MLYSSNNQLYGIRKLLRYNWRPWQEKHEAKLYIHIYKYYRAKVQVQSKSGIIIINISDESQLVKQNRRIDYIYLN